MNKIIREKHQIDATNKIGGRLATEVAILLMGKHKVSFERSIDQGDFVEIANVGLLKFSGKKLERKKYFRHSGYIGSIKETLLGKRLLNNPQQLFTDMVYNMLPKNKLRENIKKRLTYKSDTKVKED